MVKRRKRTTVGWAVAAAAVVVAVATMVGTSGAGATSKAKSYPRAETLITSGSQWGNIA